jgi:1L-myo-inositol 1-phosphate cytidylyltransferase / CDP-L-myo-inositol myo-inositolphosphotransferase
MPATVIIAATRGEAAGAAMRIAGLTVIDRALAQLGLATETRVVVVSDGSIPLPAPLPPNVEVAPVAQDGAAAAIAETARTLGAPVVGADVVRIDRSRFTGGLRVVDEASRRTAEDAVFAALYRPDLGFVARRLNKPISVRLTRYFLVRTAITPNQITLFAAALGLAGCGLVASGRFAPVCLGFVLEQIQSILDGCDGELARVRFQQSRLGAWLDTFVDDVLNVLITLAVGIGLHRAGAGRWAVVVGVAGGAMLVLSNLIIMRDMRRQKASGDLMDMVWWFSGGRRLAELSGSGSGSASGHWPGIGTILFQLGRRDSAIFLWLIFAFSGWLVLVLVMAAIIALCWFVASVVQLVTAPAASAPSASASASGSASASASASD